MKKVMDNTVNKAIQKITAAVCLLTAVYIGMKSITKQCDENATIDDGNPYHPTDTEPETFYEREVKPAMDRLLSFAGLIILSPIFIMIAAAVKIDDPGPIFFTQKRVGKDGHFFMLHKFRSMKMSTPGEIPTHELNNPDQYITRVGKILRKTSLDEIPQLWDVFRGRMSLVAPRPALWNQRDLVEEREKYGANDVVPGVTGLAQISGRDELEIHEKARLDGKYVEILKKGGIRAFLFDCRCFFGTFASVMRHDGVVEGGTGNIHHKYKVRPEEVGFEDYGYKKTFNIDKTAKRSVLITGAGSYIGESFETYCKEHYTNIDITTIDMADGSWRSYPFKDVNGEPFDTVFHVAGIAHADVGKISIAERKKYYEVNTDLAIECCRKAKMGGVKQFIFMSSMIIYGEKERIDEKTVPQPVDFYGNSKWLADKGIRALADGGFQTAVIRAPMIYGKGSKGNYPRLAKIAKMAPIFPKVNNCRSMLYIENLCEFIAQLSLSGEGGVYFPQNGEYGNTAELVKGIGEASGKPTYISGFFTPAVYVAAHFPVNKIKLLAKKAFGSSYYEWGLSEYSGLDYQKVNTVQSIKKTESRQTNNIKKHIAIISSQYFWLPEEAGPTRFYSIALMFLRHGYEVTVITSSFEHHEKRQRDQHLKSPFNMIYIDCPGYDRNIDPKREISNIVFANGVKKVLKHNIAYYDAIYCSIPPNNIGAAVGKICSRQQIPFMVDVEDLWPEAMAMITEMPIIHKTLFFPYKADAEKTYRYADAIIGTSEEYSLRASKNNGLDIPYKTVYVGCDIDVFDEEAKKNIGEIHKPSDEIWVTYAGSIGTSYAIDNIVRTARILPDIDSRHIRLKILGDGPMKDSMVKLAKTLKCTNIDFLGYVDHPKMAAYLAKSDVLINSFAKGAPQSIVNKIGDYLAAGKPMVNTLENKEFCGLIDRNKVGINIKPESPEALKKGIISILSDKKRYEKMCIRARRLGEGKFDRKISYIDIVKLTDSLIEGKIAG